MPLCFDNRSKIWFDTWFTNRFPLSVWIRMQLVPWRFASLDTPAHTLDTPAHTHTHPRSHHCFGRHKHSSEIGFLSPLKCAESKLHYQKDMKPFSASIGHKQLASKLNTWVHFEDYQKVSSMYRKVSWRTCDAGWRSQPRLPSQEKQASERAIIVIVGSAK